MSDSWVQPVRAALDAVQAAQSRAASRKYVHQQEAAELFANVGAWLTTALTYAPPDVTRVAVVARLRASCASYVEAVRAVQDRGAEVSRVNVAWQEVCDTLTAFGVAEARAARVKAAARTVAAMLKQRRAIRDTRPPLGLLERREVAELHAAIDAVGRP